MKTRKNDCIVSGFRDANQFFFVRERNGKLIITRQKREITLILAENRTPTNYYICIVYELSSLLIIVLQMERNIV